VKGSWLRGCGTLNCQVLSNHQYLFCPASVKGWSPLRDLRQPDFKSLFDVLFPPETISKLIFSFLLFIISRFVKEGAKVLDPDPLWDRNDKNPASPIPANKTRCKFSKLFEADLGDDNGNKVWHDSFKILILNFISLITVGQRQTDSNNQLILISNRASKYIRYKRVIWDLSIWLNPFNRLILLSMITLNGTHCT